jgi:hypothetical protein
MTPPLDGRSIGCADGWLTGGIRKPLPIQPRPRSFVRRTACTRHRHGCLPREAAARMDVCDEACERRGPGNWRGQSEHGDGSVLLREAAVRALSTPAGDYQV